MKKKKFDCVKMMREIRDEISRKLSSMTVQEQLEYLKNKVEKSNKSDSQGNKSN
jgi:hypothetical protein